jgi:predicted transcriptional regulator
MTLDEYLKETGETLKVFAERAGLPLSTVWRASLPPDDPRACIPHRRNRRKIELATDGKVTFHVHAVTTVAA